MTKNVWNRPLWNFWELKLRRLKILKGSTYPLTFGGKSLEETLQKRFSGNKRQFLKEMEEFVYETCRELYATATIDIKPFPTTWKDLLKELPFDNTKYASLIEEYSEKKTMAVTNANDFAVYYNKKYEEEEIRKENGEALLGALWRTFGMGKGELMANLPLNFESNKKYNNLERMVFIHLRNEVLGGRKISKILHNEARREQLLNKILGTTDLPYDWNKKLAKKSDLDIEKTRANSLQNWKDNHTCSCSVPCHTSSHADYNQKHTESQEYQRINTKLSGKVSDSELQVLLEAVPNCPHSDYDNLKSERDALKTENTQLKEHKCDCDSKVAQKEKEIINKIITDLELSTERERERENILEAVIAEIKSKITPPSDLTQLQIQLKNKETEITALKRSNKSYLDLEKLVQQKQNENQALTTAKNELESQLNGQQKELLNQVLNKSSEVKEKVYKEEVIKSIETALTSQGIDSQSFRKEITNLSSLTDIQQLSGKYSTQRIDELKDDKKSAHSLNIILGLLSLVSLIMLAYLLIKRAGEEKILKEKKESD